MGITGLRQPTSLGAVGIEIIDPFRTISEQCRHSIGTQVAATCNGRS
jgi:hypothetical protein